MSYETAILSDELGDWRLEAVRKVKGDHVFPGGPVKDGTLLWKSTWTKEPIHGEVTFPTPHPVALALSVALNAALQARLLRGEVNFPKRMAGGGRGAEGEHVPPLFSYFEQCMVTAVFAFQALELWANHSIAGRVEQPLTVVRDKRPKQLKPDELERKLSTEEKLLKVLPQIFSKKFDHSSELMRAFQWLKSVRDATVHLKSGDHYVRGKIDEDSVYHRFLNDDPLAYVLASVRLMKHFTDPERVRWLEAAYDFARGIAATSQKP